MFHLYSEPLSTARHKAGHLVFRPTPTRLQLDAASERIFMQLRQLVHDDPGTRQWLQQLSTWMFPK
jgi:hypothetical protein